MASKIPTGMSQAHWFEPTAFKANAPQGSFEPAVFGEPFGAKGEDRDAGGTVARSKVFWLDELLHGGIQLPYSQTDKLDGDRPALVILLLGPPGTGKTTLATELCYRWTLASKDNPDPEKRRVLYITTESPVKWFINNAVEFGWNEEQFEPYQGEDAVHRHKAGKTTVQIASAADAGSLKSWMDEANRHNAAGATKLLGKVAQVMTAAGPRRSGESAANGSGGQTERPGKWGDDPPFAVVLDSLNTVSDRLTEDDGGVHGLFNDFQKLVSGGPKIAILVLDSGPSGQGHAFWEYACDLVIRLDRNYPQDSFDYLHRTVEIVKARYQPHAWGPHQYKIYEKKPKPNASETASKEAAQEQFYAAQRAFPFRTDGGFYVLPSLHFLLSQYKRLNSTKEPEFVSTPVPGLEGLLKDGFPLGRCTALMGSRGGHKSHLGLMQILSGVLKEELWESGRRRFYRDGPEIPAPTHAEKAIVISLRDDDSLTRKTMNAILEEWSHNSGFIPTSKGSQRPWPDVWELEKQGRLEIMYFPPGNITAEEFVHRVMVSVQRLNRPTGERKSHVSLLFNSLDQLRHRFPLCYRQNIFISGLIQMLSAERVTSIFVTATGGDPSQMHEDTSAHGLDSIAELILRFKQQAIEPDGYRKAVGVLSETAAQGWLKSVRTKRSCVVVEVERFAGGQAAGKQAILELTKKTDNALIRDLSSICSQEGRTGLNAFVLQES